MQREAGPAVQLAFQQLGRSGFSWETARGTPVAEARTVVVNVFAFVLTAYLFNCLSLDRPATWRRVRRNPWVAAAVLALLGLRLFYTCLPSANALFGSAPLNGADWLRVTVAAIVAYAAVEAVKAAHRLRRDLTQSG